MNTDYQFCILTNKKDIIEYEKQLFNAFSKRSPDGWVMSNYEIIDGERLRSKCFTYEDQLISIVKHNDEIIAGNAVNLNPSKE